MPVIEGVGQSDNTYLKQNTLSDLLNVHVKISQGILYRDNLVKKRKKYLYVDLNAGSGFYNQIKGSPALFLETAARKRLEEPFIVQLCEIDKHSTESLISVCKDVLDVSHEYHIPDKRTCVLLTKKGSVVKIVNRDNKTWVEDTATKLQDYQYPKYVGAIYSDPNGCETFDNLIKLSNIKCLWMVDIVMHISATTIKRVCCANPKATRLTEGIERINKKYWWIRLPYGPFQWTFLIGTNWGNFPDLETCGFYRTDTDEGRKILNYTNHTQKEVEELFPKQNIKPTVSISNTRHSKHLERLSSKELSAYAKSVVLPRQLKFII